MIKALQIFIEIALAGFILVVCYSQLIRPIFRRTPLFPFFRRRPNLEREIEKIDESLEDAETRKRLEKRKVRLEKSNSQRSN